MDQDLAAELKAAQERIRHLDGAMHQERRKRKAGNSRVSFYENVVAEFSKATRRTSRDEWAHVTPKVRFAVLLRDKFSCTYCGASRDQGARLEIDHFTPVSAGGRTTISNLRTACSDCNQGKKDALIDLEAMARPPRHLPAAVAGESRSEASDQGRRPSDSPVVLGSHPGTRQRNRENR